MPEQNIKHLEFVQAMIARMNTNSFQLKGWTITIISALLAVSASTKKEGLILISLLPITIFWCLDTYYLMQERKLRGLYNDIAGISSEPKALKAFEIRLDLYVGEKYSYFNIFKAPSIMGLYLPLILILISTYFYLTCKGTLHGP